MNMMNSNMLLFPKEKQELLPPEEALGLGSERPWTCSEVCVFPGAQSRAWERKRRWERVGCPLSLPEGQPPALASASPVCGSTFST